MIDKECEPKRRPCTSSVEVKSGGLGLAPNEGSPEIDPSPKKAHQNPLNKTPNHGFRDNNQPRQPWNSPKLCRRLLPHPRKYAHARTHTSSTTPPHIVPLPQLGTPTASVSQQTADVQRLLQQSKLSYSMHSAGTTLGKSIYLLAVR